MLYADYARRKMHNVVKLDTKEGYPLTVYNCANKNLKDYTIYGNTGGVGDKTENVFNYTEPLPYAPFRANQNGWFNVTIDNTKGTSTVYKSCSTTVNSDLKLNTNYYLVLEVAEKTGDIGLVLCSKLNSTSQFNTTLLIYSPNVGITSPQKIVSKSTFNDGTTVEMLRTHAFCEPGKSGHIKFRIAVYEIEKNYFEPYDKYKIPITVTGKNLLNFDGIEDITLDATTGAIRGGWAFRNLNAGTYTLSANISIPNASLYAHIVVNGVSQPTILISGASQSLTVNENDTILIYTPSTSATLGKTYLANKGITSLQFEKGTTATSYEPYHEPVTTNIYRDVQLGQGESINYKADNLPDIMLKKDTNIITADTEVKPSSIKIKYLKK